MSSAKYLGPVSLGLCVVGMIAMETLIHTGVCANPWWRVLAMGFEAGTIGGMADWFAVSALFRTVPIPVLSRHTNIIAKNRTKIVENLKDYVQNKLLTPTVIREKLAGVRFSALALQHLDAGDHRQQLHQVVRSTFGTLLADLDRDDLVQVLNLVAAESLRTIEVAKPVGAWLRQSIEHGDHAPLWEGLISEGQKFVAHDKFKQRIVEIIKLAAAKERGEGMLKKLFMSTAEATGGFKYESWAVQLASTLGEWLEGLKRNPNHDFRHEADRYLIDYATALETGRPDAVAAVDTFKQDLLQKVSLEPLIRIALGNLKANLQRQLTDETSSLSTMVAAMVNRLVEKFSSDPNMQALVDQHVGQAIGKLIESNHALIGEMVGSSLSRDKISDRDLVAQIEDRIGDDLQYIRLNGAIVGGAVGALIMAVKFMLLGF